MVSIVETTEEDVQNMQELLKTAILKHIKGENVRVLVSHVRGEINRLVNLTPIRVPSKVVDLELDEFFTESSKYNFT